MNLKHTRVVHQGAGHWVVDFLSDDGEAVSVKVSDDKLSDEAEIVEHAKRIMVELTGFGTRGGRPSPNEYDAVSKTAISTFRPGSNTEATCSVVKIAS